MELPSGTKLQCVSFSKGLVKTERIKLGVFQFETQTNLNGTGVSYEQNHGYRIVHRGFARDSLRPPLV